MAEVGKYAKALLGLAIFVGCILAIRTSGLLEAALAPKVQAGNVSSVDATWFLTVAESVLSFLFTWGVFAFGRVGEGGIAFVKALFGFKVNSEPAKTNAEAASEVTEKMRSIWEAIGDKRNAVVSKADQDIQASINRALSEVLEALKK